MNDYYVVVVPRNEGDFHTVILDYGITLERAEQLVRWYIKDHKLRYKVNGEYKPALIQIHKITKEANKLPDGYYLMTLKEIKTV